MVVTLDKLSEVGKTEEFKQSVKTASELRDSIVANLNIMAAEPSDQISGVIKSDQALLVQQLQSALSALQVLVLDHARDLTHVISDRALQRVADVATRLHENLSKVVSVGQFTLLQTEIANCDTEQQIPKDSFMYENSSIMIGQQGNLVVTHENSTFMKEVAHEEQVTETATDVEPVPTLTAKTENVIILESGSQLKSDNETVVSCEQAASMYSADNAAIVEMKQTEDETISAENVVVSKVETYGNGNVTDVLVVPTETLVTKEQQIAIDDTKSVAVDDDKVKEVGVLLKTEVTLNEHINFEDPNKEAASNIISANEVKGSLKSDKMVKVSSPTTGNFVLYNLLLYINNLIPTR